MEKLSVRLKISDREYPMKVNLDEEERVRKAGKLINEKLRVYREKFGIDDNQDLLAMVAFDSVVERMESEEKLESFDNGVVDRLKAINSNLSTVI